MKPESTYKRRLVAVMVAYIVVLFGSVTLLKTMSDPILRALVAVLPVLPVLVGIFVFMAFLRQLDELQRRIQFEAFAFSLGMTGVITFTLGFLEGVDVPSPGLIWVFPMMIALWGIGAAIAGRRYR
jgi:hypothetical protein